MHALWPPPCDFSNNASSGPYADHYTGDLPHPSRCAVCGRPPSLWGLKLWSVPAVAHAACCILEWSNNLHIDVVELTSPANGPLNVCERLICTAAAAAAPAAIGLYTT